MVIAVHDDCYKSLILLVHGYCNSKPLILLDHRGKSGLEQDYDAPGAEMPHPRRDDDFNAEQLMHELEDFLRQEWERGTE